MAENLLIYKQLISPRLAEEKLNEILESVTIGNHMAVILTYPPSKLYKLLIFLIQPVLILKVKLLFKKHNFKFQGIYAFYPSLEDCVVSYECKTSASVYAEKFLIPSNKSFLIRNVKSVLSTITGHSVEIDTIMLLGTRID